ncbi:hypothetical protein VTN00DRAFT_5191 [Thermoascus crustaceus]|uniref:uncharacterized protein n=1 Tax=Thermoascus crustaceus TaxID=5088 RepID=UPI00374259A6
METNQLLQGQDASTPATTIPRKPVHQPQKSATQTDQPVDTSMESSNADEEKNDRQRKKKPSPVGSIGWTTEVIASIVAIVSFAVEIWVLRRYEGQPQTAWPYSTITLNGFVALLSTITRSSLMLVVASALSQGKWLHFARQKKQKLRDLHLFDQASRGVWGSLELLCRLMPVHLASLGALLVILGIAMDTISQQLLSVDLRTVSHRSPDAKYPRSEYYNGTSLPIVTVLDFPMMAALYRGMFDSNVTDITAPCKTGNCTWPILPSLAVCGECTNRTDEIQFVDVGYGVQSRLPDGFTAEFSGVGMHLTVLRSEPIVDKDSNYTGYIYRSTTRANGTTNRLPIAHFEVMGVPPISYSDEKELLASVLAWECGLWFCVQAYNVSTEGGVQHRETIDTWTETTAPDSGPRINFTSIPPHFNVQPGVVFSVYNRTLQTMQGVTSELLNGSVMSMPDYTDNDQFQSMYNHVTHLDSWVKGVARSLSQTLQLSYPASNASDEHYAGVIFQDEFYIHVHWPWITFPCAIIVATLLYLVVVVWQTRRSYVGTWKDSILAILVAKIDDEMKPAAAENIDRQDESLVKALGAYKVNLLNERGEWEFKL